MIKCAPTTPPANAERDRRADLYSYYSLTPAYGRTGDDQGDEHARARLDSAGTGGTDAEIPTGMAAYFVIWFSRLTRTRAVRAQERDVVN